MISLCICEIKYLAKSHFYCPIIFGFSFPLNLNAQKCKTHKWQRGKQTREMIKQDEECGGTKLQHIQLNLGGWGVGGENEKLKLKIGEWIKKMRDTMKKNIEEGDGYWKHWQG